MTDDDRIESLNRYIELLEKRAEEHRQDIKDHWAIHIGMFKSTCFWAGLTLVFAVLAAWGWLR